MAETECLFPDFCHSGCLDDGRKTCFHPPVARFSGWEVLREFWLRVEADESEALMPWHDTKVEHQRSTICGMAPKMHFLTAIVSFSFALGTFLCNPNKSARD